ncbi:MAG TPA: sugar phosphate nucleotidyltransferase [Kiritimatiellia bacterium]|nr:sugar phosphate nucleotidyltransferase [Kiritimatiellia bacterium]
MTPDTAMILAGGLGTRLRSLYPDRPKALVPIKGRPFIEHMIDSLVAQGIRRIHLAAGYRAQQLVDWAETREQRNLHITVSIEPEPLGTGGGVRFAAPHLPSDQPWFVFNGDSLLPRARLSDLVHAATRHPGVHATLAVVEMTQAGRYGTVDLDPDHFITGFHEKADREHGLVNGGIYLFTPALIASLPPDRPCSLEQEIFPGLATRHLLLASPVPPPLLDMGTPQGITAMEASF